MIRRIRHVVGSHTTSLGQMLHLAWQAHPDGLVGLLGIELAQGLLPLATSWLTKLLFDRLATGTRTSGPTLPTDFLLVLLALTAITALGQMLTPLSSYCNFELGQRLTLVVQRSIYQKINSLVGLAPFEDPAFHDTLQLATDGATHGPTQTLQIFTTFVRSLLTLGAFLGLLLAFNPLLTLIIALAVGPQLYMQFRQGRQRFVLAAASRRQERQASYYGAILSGLPFAKEVRLLNLADYFLTRFLAISQALQQARRQQQQRELRGQLALVILGAGVVTAAFSSISLAALTGHLSIGDVTLYLNAVAAIQGALAGVVFAVTRLNESLLFYTQYTVLMTMPQPLPLAAVPCPVPPLTHGIELHDVSFRYSPEQPWVLRHVNLWIPAGSCLALVGLNGAGKTTLVKLLARLYDPTEGVILWDGVDIRDFDPSAYRERIGAIVQDFLRLDLTVQENIGLGNIHHVDDEAAVQRAARQAGVHDRILQLSQGYTTALSRWLTEGAPGVDLSGGEWQKVALARMFMREADLLMLDEPTAALDAQAEYELYQHFATLMAGRTSLLISHRFSSVRMADLIAVLENGQITEYGPHSELLRNDQSYAQLYRVQAAAYQ